MYKLNRDRLVQRIKDYNVAPNSLLVLQGNTSASVEVDDTDKDRIFRQESNFHYLFGVDIADCFGIINVRTNKTYLIIPKHDESYAVWHGKVHDLEWYSQKYLIEDIIYITDTLKISSIFANIDNIHIIGTPNIYTKRTLPQINLTNLGLDPNAYNHLIRRDVLYHAICDIRVIKTDYEIEVLHKINKISSDAHCQVMKQCKPTMSEGELAMIFGLECTKKGAKHLAYPSIVGSGVNSAILHYVENDQAFKDGDLVLCDMGSELEGYASDITRTFPVSGKFTPKQADIYNLVLKAQTSVITQIIPGIDWSSMHYLSLKVICDGLYDYGLIQGDKSEVDDNYKEIAKYFMPHGIGHLMGKDVHDVGQAGHIAYCRKPNTILARGMVLTVEPGIYFIEPLLESGYKNETISKYLNKVMIDQYLDFGGIRIEDDIVVTDSGCVVLTTAPKTIAEIEQLMASN